MQKLSESKKSQLLEKAVVCRKTREVRSIFAQNGPLAFIDKALAMATRFGSPEIVQLLLEHNATLSCIPSRITFDAWDDGGEVKDLAAFIFPNVKVTGPDRNVVSAETRMEILRCLREHNTPGLHNMLYYAILYDDEEVYEYLTQTGIQQLQSPYADILTRNLTQHEVDKLGYGWHIRRLRRILNRLADDALLLMLERYCKAVSGRLRLYRLDLLKLDKAASGKLLKFCVEKTDYGTDCPKSQILYHLIRKNNAGGLSYASQQHWMRGSISASHLLEFARAEEGVSPETLTVLLQATKSKARSTSAASKSLSLTEEKKPTLSRLWSYDKLYDGTYEITSYKGDDTEIVIPTAIGRNTVTSITSGMFSLDRAANERIRQARAAITRVEFPGILREIPDSIFAAASSWRNLRVSRELQTVVIQDGIQSIGRDAFRGCQNLEHVELPPSLQTIGQEAFRTCLSLRHLDLPESLHSIECSSFRSSGLQEISMPFVKRIDSSAFQQCKSLESVQFGDGLLQIGDHAFARTKVQEIELPASLEEIGPGAFEACKSLECVRFQKSDSSPALVLKAIAFEFCSKLRTIELANNLEFIGKRAFQHCESLLSIRIPSSVKKIEFGAFYGCSNLSQVSIYAQTQVAHNAFSGCPKVRIEKRSDPN